MRRIHFTDQLPDQPGTTRRTGAPVQVFQQFSIHCPGQYRVRVQGLLEGQSLVVKKGFVPGLALAGTP